MSDLKKIKPEERAAFEAWAASVGFCVTGKYAETVDVLCAESAFKAGYRAGLSSLQSQSQEIITYVTRNEEGDSAMLFFDLQEARLYCEPGEEPEALVLAGPARRIEGNEK